MDNMSRVLASLVVVLSFGLTQADCGRGADSSATDPPPPPDYCAVPAPPTTYSAQYLVGGDILQSNTLWVFKLDSQTGVPTAMPWSPLILDGYVLAVTADATGDYLYVAVQTGWTSESLETFGFPRDGSPPVQVDSQNLMVGNSPSQLVFDAQQRYLYEVNRGGVPTQSSISIFRVDYAHIPRDTGQTISFKDDASTIVFKDSGRIALVSRQHAEGTGVAVLARDCATGALTQVSETAVPNSIFLTGAPKGTGSIGYYIGLAAQPMRYDARSQAVAFDSTAALPFVWLAAFDHAGDFVVTTNAEGPQRFTPNDVVKVYRYDSDQVILAQTDQFQFPLLGGTHQGGFNVGFDLNDNFVYIEVAPSSLGVFRLDHASGKITPIPGSQFAGPVALDPLLVFGQN